GPQDLERGFLLLDDLGRQTYLDVINEDNADALFADAIQALLAFQALPVSAQLPRYDEALLRRELQLFPEWYVQRHLGCSFSPAQQQLWERSCQLLVDAALAQPTVLVHRDYMPRNLMISEPNPGVLDFQDAVMGPVTYDITSLFKDAFLSWPEQRVQGWLQGYWDAALAAGIPVQGSFAEFQRASDLMGLQRHLKVIGIFARICHRDGKPRYLADVPRFFTYIEMVLARRPELAELAQLLRELPSPQVSHEGDDSGGRQGRASATADTAYAQAAGKSCRRPTDRVSHPCAGQGRLQRTGDQPCLAWRAD